MFLLLQIVKPIDNNWNYIRSEFNVNDLHLYQEICSTPQFQKYINLQEDVKTEKQYYTILTLGNIIKLSQNKRN